MDEAGQPKTLAEAKRMIARLREQHDLPEEYRDLGPAWRDAEQALLEHRRATGGGSPYMSVAMDLVGWAVAEGMHSRGQFSGEGDPGPASAFRALAKNIRAATAELPPRGDQ